MGDERGLRRLREVGEGWGEGWGERFEKVGVFSVGACWKRAEVRQVYMYTNIGYNIK